MSGINDIILPDELNEALKIAISEVKNGVAQTYLRAMEKSIIFGTRIRKQKEAIRTQLLYILANLQTWRGENARKCKGIFKKYVDKWD